MLPVIVFEFGKVHGYRKKKKSNNSVFTLNLVFSIFEMSSTKFEHAIFNSKVLKEVRFHINRLSFYWCHSVHGLLFVVFFFHVEFIIMSGDNSYINYYGINSLESL